MKVTLLFLAVIGLANASVFIPVREQFHKKQVTTKTLDDLLKEFVAFIPFAECLGVVNEYLATDKDVQEAYAFLKSDTFKTLTDNVVAMPEYQDALKYLSDAGLDIYTYQNIFRKILGLPTIPPPTLRQKAVRESGIILMINDILAVIPIPEIKKWFYNTCLPDPAFQDLIMKLRSPEFRDLIDNIHNSVEYRSLTDVLRKQGVDVDAIEKAIADYISQHYVRRVSPRTLRTLVDQFVAFLPTDDLLNILITYVSTDPDVMRVVTFMQGEVFKGLVVNMEASPELNAFLAWVYGKGIDVYNTINMVLELLGQPPFVPPQLRRPSTQSGLTDMINEMLALLPVADIVAWYHNTCEIDPEFQELMTKLKGDDFLTVVARFRADPAFNVMRSGLTDLGIDMVAVEAWLNRVFGWPIPSLRMSPRTLRTLVDQFVAFLPTDDLLNILITYVSTDPDVMRVVTFMQGEVFKGLVVNMEASPELNAFLAWVNGKGIDVYNTINMVLELLGQPPFVPPQLRRPSTQSGLTDMINEMLALLPVADIVAWYHNTCEIDPEFQELMTKLKGDDFLTVVARFRADPAFNVMRSGLTDLGIDMVAVEAWLNRVFGWPIPSLRMSPRTLRTLVDQFVAFLPTNDLLSIFITYVSTDPDVIRVMTFMQGEVFKGLVVNMEASPELNTFLAWVYGKGIDVYNTINMVLEFLGQPPFVPPQLRRPSTQSGLTDMINEMLALLPVADIVAWYHNTCEIDPEFQKLMYKLKGYSFLKVVARFRADPAFNVMRSGLTDLGIDMVAVEAWLNHVFGWPIPSLRMSPRTLRTLVDQFVAFLPTDDLLNILITYVSTDPDVMRVVTFMQGEVFKGLVVNMEASPELNAFLAWVNGKGIDVYNTINMVLELLGQPPFVPPQLRRPSTQSGLTDMINEMLALLPVADIVAWYHNTCEIDPEFQELMTKLKGDDFLTVVARFRADPAFNVMRSGLTDLGIDMVAVEAWLNRVFGWPIPSLRMSPRTLRTLVDQFVAFLPTDDLLNILITYVSTDPDVMRVVTFMQGEVFKGLVVNMEASPELNAFLAWVHGKGIDVYNTINMVLELLGQPPFVPPHLRRPSTQSGLTDMINEMLALLPVADIVAWYHNTCEIDPEFQELMTKLKGDDFLTVVARFRADPAFNVMRSGLTDLGIDMVAVEAWLNRVFGWPIPSLRMSPRTLRTLVDQFVSFLPTDDLLNILITYVSTDPDVMRVVTFMQGEVFKGLVVNMEASPELNAFLAWVHGKGIDVYNTINMVLELLGQPPFVPPQLRRPSTQSGLTDMINEMLALLPVADIVAWYHNTCEIDPEFQELMTKLKGDDFLTVVARFRADPAFNVMRSGLTDLGIDMVAVEAWLNRVFGWPIPSLRMSPRTLRTLVDQFVAFLPTDDLLNILITYVSTDPDVMRVVTFMQGEVFKGLVVNMEASPELNAFLAWVYGKGIDVYNTINMVLELLGQPPFVPPQLRRPSTQSGLTDMINEMLALLPVADIVAWYHNTCEIDPEFQELMTKLKGDDFLTVVARFRADPAFNVMRSGLTDLGIDMVAVEAWLNRVFGWPIPSRM